MRPTPTWTALLRVEDAVLVLATIVLPVLAGSLSAGSPGVLDGPSVLGGLAGLAAVLGVTVCLATRGPDEPPPLADREMTLQGWARFPLAAGVGMVATYTLPGIGLDGGGLAALAFVVMFAGALLHSRLPVVPVTVRRALVLPMTIVAAGAFNQIAGPTVGGVVGGLVTGSAPREVVDFWPLILAAIGVLYAMLVIAPRAIVDPGASGVAWAVRFLLLLAGLGIGAVVGGIV